MRLKGKHIVLGITGSIAAYKAAYLLRLFMKEGAEVQVLITPSGKEFITPVTLSALSGRPVISDFFGAVDGTWNSHIDLGLWADAMVVAPATASTIAKMANGIADNMLLATYLAARSQVFVAPAMDVHMFHHPATQKNLRILESFGNTIITPGTGELASGLEGPGRMEEPENILELLVQFLGRKKKLRNKTFLVTAGPTYEKIDPVRFIGNYSSGKMGYAIARELAAEGARVKLVSGPVHLMIDQENIEVIKVESASEMYRASVRLFPECDGAVMAAAVADYTPQKTKKQKIKRESPTLELPLKSTKDIAARLGALKKKSQILVGFALETHNEVTQAKRKCRDKNLDMIVLNSLNTPGGGFNVDTNKVTLIDKNNNLKDFELKSKEEVARDIVEKMGEMIFNPGAGLD